MTDLTLWIAWLMLGVSAPTDELTEMLDQRGIAAYQAAEAAMRSKENRGGLVACTPGGDADAEERAKIIAKRWIAATARSTVSGSEAVSQAYSAAMSGRSAGAYAGGWHYVKAVLETRAAGMETCVAYMPRMAEKK